MNRIGSLALALALCSLACNVEDDGSGESDSSDRETSDMGDVDLGSDTGGGDVVGGDASEGDLGSEDVASGDMGSEVGGDYGSYDYGYDVGGGGDTAGQFQAYHYVLIVDEEPPSTTDPTSTSGVDIYGVQLIRSAGGATFNASQVHACNFGSGTNDRATDCNQVLGVPDDTCSPTADTPTYVSLGGNDGGELIVSFGDLEEIVRGDQIIVYECGAAENPSDTGEDYDFFVGVTTDPNASTWVECADDVTGTNPCTVPALPMIPVN